MWLTDSSWLPGFHERHELPRDMSWPHTLVAQSLIDRPMSGSVIYNSEMWMNEDASSPSGSIGIVNSCTQVLWAKIFNSLKPEIQF